MESLTEQFQAALPGLLSGLMLVKVSILLLAGWLVSIGLRKQAASFRHAVWFCLLLVLLLLPAFQNLMPAILLRIDSEGWLYSFFEEAGSMAGGESVLIFRNALVWTWYTITTVMLLHLLVGVLKVAGITRRASKVKNIELNQSLGNLKAVAGIEKPVQLLKSSELDSPASWGFLRPAILVPENAEDWDAATGRDVLAHELAHIERNDWLSLMIARIALALYWFHPLVWWAYARMMEEAEHACDDAVVLDHEHAEYAGTLLSMARQNRSMFRHAVHAMAQSFLGKRINAILDRGALRSYSESVFLIRATLVSVVLAALASSLDLAPVLPARANTFTITMPDSRPAERAENLLVNNLVAVDTDTRPDPGLLEKLPGVPELKTIVQRDQINAYLLSLQQQNSMQVSSVMTEAVPATVTETVRILIHQQIPEYPKRARARGIQGEVVTSYTINPDGSVSDVKIIEAEPSRVFDRAVLEAVSTYRFSRLPDSAGEGARGETRVQTFVFRLDTDP